MPKELYNEGRVVGYSAYEIYVKHALSENPEFEPATEREWLAAQLAHGTSMILRIPKESNSSLGLHYKDFPLPSNSALCTANTVVASQFFGQCEFDEENMWATKVTDYGQGISNTEQSHPTDENQFPVSTISSFAEPSYVSQEKSHPSFLQYIKIQDGFVLQEGVWKDVEDQPPYVDLIPNLKKVPTVRLIFTASITEDFYVLLTGFTNRSILAGITASDLGSTKQLKPENGDFLGPELYPWANKIVFMQSPTSFYYFRRGLSANHQHFPSIEDTEAKSHSNQKNLAITASDDSIDTIFKVSDLYPGEGIAIQPPSEPGAPFYISSKIKSANKYLKVTQVPGDNKDNITTTLQPTTFSSDSSSGVQVTQPSSDGGIVKISSKVTGDKYIGVTQSNYTTALNLNIDKVAEDAWNRYIKNQVSIMISNLQDSLRAEIKNADSNLVDILNAILSHVIGNERVTGNNPASHSLTWDGTGNASDEKIPLGNLNISTRKNNDIYDRYLFTHNGDLDGDVKVN